jgi:hypothetical protein
LRPAPGIQVSTTTECGLVVAQRAHHQITGEPMKFLTLADWTGFVETELFAHTNTAKSFQRRQTISVHSEQDTAAASAYPTTSEELEYHH